MTAVESLLDRAALRKYERDGVEALTTGERVLVAMRWFDWITAGDLLDAMDIEDPLDRQAYARALYYRVQCGQVEARGEFNRREYRLAVKTRRAA